MRLYSLIDKRPGEKSLVTGRLNAGHVPCLFLCTLCLQLGGSKGSETKKFRLYSCFLDFRDFLKVFKQYFRFHKVSRDFKISKRVTFDIHLNLRGESQTQISQKDFGRIPQDFSHPPAGSKAIFQGNSYICNFLRGRIKGTTVLYHNDCVKWVASYRTVHGWV